MTRERARQLRNRAIKEIVASSWVHVSKARIDKLLENRREPLYLDVIAAEDQWFDRFQNNVGFLGRLLEVIDRDIHVWQLDGRPIATRCSYQAWLQLVDSARLTVEAQIGSVVTRSEVRVLISGVAFAAGTPDLAQRLADKVEPLLHFAAAHGENERLISVGLGLRHAITAILRESDRALSLGEIRDRLRIRALGHKDREVTDNVLRTAIRDAGGELFGRSLYGLAKHTLLSAAEFEDVLAETEALMQPGSGNRHWHCSELADRLGMIRPEFGESIDKYVINVVLRASERATYLGRFVWVIKSDGNETQDRMDVAALCEAALVQAGRPLTKRELREAIEQVRGLNNLFLPQPSGRVVRLARGLWGLSDRDVGVTLEDRKSTLDALFRVLNMRQIGLHVSELVAALEAIAFARNPELDEYELLGLSQADSRFRVGRGQIVGLSSWSDLRRLTVSQAFAQIAQSSGGSLSLDDLHRQVISLVGRNVPKASVESHAARAGLQYDLSSNRFHIPTAGSDLEAGIQDEETV